MAWDFDSDLVLEKLQIILDQMVGIRLSTLKNSDGSDTGLSSIIIDNQNAPEPELPFITLSYQGSNNNNGYLLHTGVIEDPVDTFTPYWDTFTPFGVMLRCEGDEALSILREIRKKFLLERYRADLRGDTAVEPLVYSVVDLITPITRTPDLLATEYREVGSMLLQMSTVDRLLDPDTGTFGTIEYESHYKKIDSSDPDTVDHEGSVTTPSP